MTKDELLGCWQKLPGKQLPPGRVDRLLRELAYRLQERQHGRLDKNTTVSLRRHMAMFEASLDLGTSPPTVKTPSKLTLEVGSVISRKWNGRQITLHVVGERKFQFEGRCYKSLSKIAREITGQHLSGPLFFGLKEVRSE